MCTRVPESATQLINAKVTGFPSVTMAYLAYVGSTSWMIFLIGYDVVLLMNRPAWTTLLAVLIGLNSMLFLAQTVDVLLFHFRFWPVTAINWTGQLSALALSSALVVESDMTITIPRVVAQAIFTSSQFAVTLEYLVRATMANAIRPVAVTSRLPMTRPGIRV